MEAGSRKQEARTTGSIKSFTDLETWQEGHRLVLMLYKLTKKFPKEEQFSLVNQIRRAVVSVASNIAEGFTRQSIPDKLHFYTMAHLAHSSATEVQNQILIARDVGYITTEEFIGSAKQTVTVHKLIAGLIRITKRREK